MRMKIVLSNKLAEKLRRSIPRGSRSMFIAQVIREKLPEWKKQLRDNKGK